MKKEKEQEVTITIEDFKETQKMVEANGFSSIKEFLDSRYTMALRTYRRQNQEE